MDRDEKVGVFCLISIWRVSRLARRGCVLEIPTAHIYGLDVASLGLGLTTSIREFWRNGCHVPAEIQDQLFSPCLSLLIL